jgi:formate-dependent nitrite reductase membrane component NrfD
MSNYLYQGTLNFAPGYKLQTRWGLTEAAVFTLETAGALLVALAVHWGAPQLAFVIGIAMVVVAVILLFLHLGHPTRAWRAMINVRTSWISRGTLALGAFVVCGLWYVLLDWTSVDAAQAGGLKSLLAWVVVPLALFIGLYPGLILSASPAISFWSSALLPVLSLLQGGATAVLMLLAFRAYGVAGVDTAMLWGAIWVLAALAVALALYLAAMLRRGAAAAESARYLLREQRGQFLGVACAVGVLLPLILVAFVVGSYGGAQLLATAAIARFIGDLALRHAFLKVGMFDPVI